MLYLTKTLKALLAVQNTIYVVLSATYMQVFWKLILKINFQTIGSVSCGIHSNTL